MAVKNFRELFAWQRSMELVEMVYRVTSSFPSNEMFGLTNQLRRAAVSIPSNIAEGQGRNTTTDFLRFLSIREAHSKKSNLSSSWLDASDISTKRQTKT